MGLGTVTGIEEAEAFEHDPQDFYDELPQASQDLWDAVAAKGWTPGHVSLGFIADKPGEDQLGPLESISGLWEAVAELQSAGVPETENSETPNSENSATRSPVYCGTPSPAEDGTFCRLELGHEGPCSTTEVVEVTEDHKGNRFFEGFGPVVDVQLAEAAGRFHADNNDWKEAGKRRKESQTALDAVVEIKRDLFKQDPDNTHSLIYHAGGLLIRIAKESKTKVTVEEEGEDA